MADVPGPMKFDKTIGVLLVGLFFNTYLYGLVTAQFLSYYNTDFKDPLWIKIVVATLFFLDTAHSAVAVHNAWEICVANFANPAILAISGWQIPFTAVCTSIVAIISQLFLGYRLYRLTRSWILFGLIAVLGAVGAVAGIVAGVRSGIIWYVADFGVLKPNVIVWLGFQTATDLLITSGLTVTLTRSRTGFQKTDSTINRLIRGAVQTGLFVSIFALGDLFSFVLHGDTLLYAMFAYPIGRIYTNTLMDTLNQRRSLTNALVSTGVSGDVGTEFDPRFRARTNTSTKLSTQLDIRMDTTRTVDCGDSPPGAGAANGGSGGDSTTWQEEDETPRATEDAKYRPEMDAEGVFVMGK